MTDVRTLPICRKLVLIGYIYKPCNRRIGHDGKCKPARAGQSLKPRALDSGSGTH